MSSQQFYAWFLVLAVAAAALADGDPAIQDARLNDVFFVNATHGWAVGDRGAIWHTADGGRSWRLQPIGTQVSLRSVWFVDQQTGWIVGGQGLPYSSATSGLVLATWDGGRNWQPLSWQQFPRLHRVQFLNANAGWVCGEVSDAFPAGVLASDNAGRTWHPVTGWTSRGWLAAAFSGRDDGVLGGPDGTLSAMLDRKMQRTAATSLGARSIRGLKLASDRTVWAVADGGVVLRSDSHGTSWSLPSERMPAELRAIFDWRGVHAIGEQVWVAGRPGTVVMHSPDSGNTWRAFPTGQTVPLEAVWFHDRQRGWAVGAFGTILGTADGGRSWHVQRRGGERAAFLAVHGEPATAPLVTHVHLGADQGYLAVDLAMVSPRRDADQPERVGHEARHSDSIVVAGGGQAEVEWRFPANPVALSLSQTLDDWNRRSDGRALRELERRLVVAIRTWRPEIIVADSPDPSEAPDPASALVSQVLARAFESAADAASFPELVEHARLEPWAAKKLFATTRGITPDLVRLDASRPARATGEPLGNLASLAAALMFESCRPIADDARYKLVASRLPPQSDNLLMAGISLEPGGPARRALPPPKESSEATRLAEQARRNLLAVADQAEGQPVLADQLTAQLDHWLKELDPTQAGTMLLELARRQFERGRWCESRDLFEKLVQDYPQHIATGEALRWLVQFYASSEAQHRERGSSAVIGGGGGSVPWGRGTLDAASKLRAFSPLAWSDPAVQFPLATAHRMLGNVKDADKFYLTMGLNRDGGPWAQAAEAERWIRDREGRAAKPLIVSRRAAAPPHLDGWFDDAVWRSAPEVALADLTGEQPAGWETELRLAHDGQFLYVALSCNSPAGERVTPKRPRKPDADLSIADRVELYFDLDRDYSTYYRLAVDQRGRVSDDCWGDRSWNPAWYVASRNDEMGYRVEAAIPLAALTARSPAGSVWAFNAVRVVPGERIVAWSRPAGVAPRLEGCGLLFFSDAVSAPVRSAVAN